MIVELCTIAILTKDTWFRRPLVRLKSVLWLGGQQDHEGDLREDLERRAQQAVLGEISARRKLYLTGYDLEIRNLERRNSESQWLQLSEANQRADQAQRERIHLCSELEMKNRLHQDCCTIGCQEFEELRRRCSKEENGASRQRLNKYSLQQDQESRTVSLLRYQIRKLQDRLEFIEDSKIFQAPDSPSSFGSAHVAHQALIPSSSKKPSRESRMQRNTTKGCECSRKRFWLSTCPTSKCLKNHTMIQEIWQHHRGFREEKELRKVGVKNHCKQCLYLAFQETLRKKVWTTGIVLSLWRGYRDLHSKLHDKSESSFLGDASGENSPTIRNSRAGLWTSEQRFSRRQRIPHARCSGSRKSKQPNHWMTLITTKSITGKDFTDFEELDLMMASALKRCHEKQTHFRKKISVEEQRAQKDNRDKLLIWSMNVFDLLDPMMKFFKDYRDCSVLNWRTTTFQDFGPREAVVQHPQKTRWTKRIQRKAFLIGYKPFTENLEDLETHVPAHPSEREISDSEGDASKVETRKRKRSIFHTSQKTEIAKYALEPWLRDSVQKTQWGIYSSSRKVWWFDTGRITKSSMKDVNLETITGTLSWYKISPLSGYNLVCVRTRIRRRRKRVKSYFYGQFIRIGKSFEELSWNHRTSTLSRSKTNGIAERAFSTSKRGNISFLIAIRIGW